MRLALLSPVAWSTPPRHYGPWESVVSLLAEGLAARGVEVTLFATQNSRTRARLHAVAPRGYEEDPALNPKVWECLHISELFERAAEFDLIHNNFDYLPLTYTGLVRTPVITTIHGFSSPAILPVYKKYNGRVTYVAISDADRSPELDYAETIHHGIDIRLFTFSAAPSGYLLFFGRFHRDKGAKEAIEIARACGRKLVLAGIVQDADYFHRYVEPFIDGVRVIYAGSAGPPERDRLLGGAAALLHPINFDEPFGLAVVEAMACGTPTIAISRGSMPEIIQDGINGFLVSDVASSIEAVARIPEIDRRQCRATAQEKFTADRMVSQYASLYDRVLAEPAGYLSERRSHAARPPSEAAAGQAV